MSYSTIRALTLSSAVFLALAAPLPSSASETAGSQLRVAAGGKTAQTPTQKDKDFEHELVQSDGVNHPREKVKDGKAASKAPAATKKTQRDLDLEHEMVQTEGVNHPRQKITDKNVKSPAKPGTPAKKTQRDLDLEHEMVQSEGVNHPREVIKKK